MAFVAKVSVTPKPAILDPEGKAVANSLHSLGYDEVEDVRVGKLILLRLAGSDPSQAAKRVDDMCKRLLANQVIEDYHFEIEPEEPSRTP